MAKAREHDPVALLRFALRERDWALADLIARFLVRDERSRPRLEHELDAAARMPGAPGTLAELHRLGRLARELEREPAAD